MSSRRGETAQSPFWEGSAGSPSWDSQSRLLHSLQMAPDGLLLLTGAHVGDFQPYHPLGRWHHQPLLADGRWARGCLSAQHCPGQGLQPGALPSKSQIPGKPRGTQIPTFCPQIGTLQADPSRGLLWASPRAPFRASLGTGVSGSRGQIVFQSKFQRDYTTLASNRSEPALPSPALLLKKGEQGPRRLQNKLQSCQRRGYQV